MYRLVLWATLTACAGEGTYTYVDAPKACGMAPEVQMPRVRRESENIWLMEHEDYAVLVRQIEQHQAWMRANGFCDGSR